MYTTLLVGLPDRYEPALPETIPEYHAQRMSDASLRLRLRHYDDARNQISCFASPIFVLASSNVLTVRSSGYEIEVGRRSHESTPQGIRAPATHHLPLYTIFFSPLLSPAKGGAPPARLAEWHTWLVPTFDNPPVAGSIPRRADIFQLELGNNKETRRLPVSSHLEEVVSFALPSRTLYVCLSFLIEVKANYSRLGLAMCT
jgi:hypothetical protein